MQDVPDQRPPPVDRRVEQEMRRAVRRRVRTFPAPDVNFNPLQATDAQLERFGLPLRPDAERHPRMFALWARMLSPPLIIREAAFGFETGFRHNFLMSSTAGGGAGEPRSGVMGTSRHGTSENWSGAIIAANGGERFTRIWATWQVPTPAMPQGLAGMGAPAPEYRCSAWVGLDGHRLGSVSLPQLGTTSILTTGAGGVPSIVVPWHQWWVRDQEYGPVTFTNLNLDLGDEVICTLTVLDEDTVRFHIKNQTKGPLVTDEWDADRPEAPVEGSAGEWIVERPTELNSDVLYPLPDYAFVDFSGCSAETSDVPPFPPVAITPRDLDATRLTRMVEEYPNPTRICVISEPQKFGPADLRLSYRTIPP
jgi:hypothetical protein